ncbi:MAG TPA: hypothetical protein VGS27_24465 [Candidatus Sulfotelmatobacter sp.]|nr:hypothetical protein [Candidatus Sulfotelmatobacter sp.]
MSASHKVELCRVFDIGCALLLIACLFVPGSVDAKQHNKLGLGSTVPGGLLALPPEPELGPSVLSGSFEAGATGWYIPRCWSIDSSVAHSGTKSLRFDAGLLCVTSVYAPTFSYTANVSYTLSAWVKASSGSNLQARLYVFDDTAGTLPIASSDPTAIGSDWTHIILPHVDLLPLHKGDALRTRLVVSAPTGQTPTGTLWFDDVTAQPELPLPISSFLLYPNFRGYLWQDGPQQIRLHMSTPNAPTGAQAQIVVQQEGGPIVTTVTKPAAAGEQEIAIDGSKLALGSYLLHENLLDPSGKILATYPDYRITKVGAAFKSGLVNYIDADNFLVHNGRKEFVWGAYDRQSVARCYGCMYRTAQEYQKAIKGFDGKSTLENYQDTHLNALINFSPWSAIAPGPPALYDQLDPALEALQARGVGYLQTVNNWVKKNRYRPFWATPLNDQKLWETAAKMLRGKRGALGYYTFDEPKLDELSVVFDQYKVLRDGNPGSVAYGALINSVQIFRWRDAADVIGCDPYPVGVPITADEYSLGLKLRMPALPFYEPPLLRVPLWTRETERQVDHSRPVWMVLQLFRQWGKFPTYDQMKSAAYSAIVNGANGVLWWGFVSAQGLEGEWYTDHNQQPYYDFKRLSDEVTPLEPYLIAPPQPHFLKSVSDSKIETLVKADSSQVVIFSDSLSPDAAKSVHFVLSGAAAGQHSVEVYSEKRTLQMDANGSFTDSFNPYEAHVYVVKLK